MPENCEHLCHDPVSSPSASSILQLQRPCLAMVAALGAYIGLRYGRMGERNTASHSRHNDDVLLSAISDSWSKASTFFGCMNIVALLHHCIYPSNILWFLDCAFTGISSLSLTTTAMLLWALYLSEYFSERLKKILENETNESIGRYIRMIEGAMKVVVAIIIHTGLSVLGVDEKVEISVAEAANAVELFYFTPLVMMILVLYPITWIAVFKTNSASNRGPLTAILGGPFFAVGGLLAAPICQFVSDYPSIIDSTLFYDCYHLPTIIFLGCDLVFYGLGKWINDLMGKESLKSS